MKRLVLAAAVLAGCASPPEKTWFSDGFFSRWDDRQVLCSMGADATHSWPIDDLRRAIDRAADEKIVVHTYGHAPTIDLAEYEALFDYAHERGVDFVTYRDLTDRTHPRAGWAFSIDDWEVDTWVTWRDLLAAHGVKMTFFVAQWDMLTTDQRAELHALATDGHDIEPHGLHHVQAAAYAQMYGAAAYVDADVTPEIVDLTAEGFTPVAFSYPFGAHTPETDAAVLEHVSLVRSATAAQCMYPSR